MLEALAARFPERRRWTPADVEVVLAEVLAAQLDKLSDMQDRVAAEFTLETARRPETVRRLLSLIGYDALRLAQDLGEPPFDRPPAAGDGRSASERLEQYWLDHPERMDLARLAGPRAIRSQHRMVTLDDFALRLEEHPLVERAHAWESWGGSWQVIRIAVIPALRRDLDATGAWPQALADATVRFHAERALPLPRLLGRPEPARHPPALPRGLPHGRPGGRTRDARSRSACCSRCRSRSPATITRARCATLSAQALGTGPGGFFAPGRLRFGEDLWASDIVQTLLALGGVSNVCLNRFKRLGDRFPDQASSGRIALDGLEVAICDNLPNLAARGYFRLALHGGLRG
jgi:hypothetical protein